MNNIIILDGGMGTELQARGLAPGERPELFGMEHPDVIEEVHRNYIAAGSRVIYSNTFGANGHKLVGTGKTVAEVIAANVATARRAAESSGVTGVRVALDIGPIGELVEPLGTLSFEDAYELFREMVTAGEEAGADLVIFETLTDLYEVKAAVLAAKEHTKLPIWVTMTFEQNGRTFLGAAVPSVAVTLDALGVSALGVNCSLGPVELVPIVDELMEWTDLPIIVKPNAGLPDPRTGASSSTRSAASASAWTPSFLLRNTTVRRCSASRWMSADSQRRRRSALRLPSALSRRQKNTVLTARISSSTV